MSRMDPFIPRIQDNLSDQRAPNQENDLNERRLGTPAVIKSIQCQT